MTIWRIPNSSGIGVTDGTVQRLAAITTYDGYAELNMWPGSHDHIHRLSLPIDQTEIAEILSGYLVWSGPLVPTDHDEEDGRLE